MKRQSMLVVVLVCALAGWAASAAAAEKFADPKGFGKAKFGMSAAQVKKLYPKLHPAKATEEAVAKGDNTLGAYRLENQSVGPLKPCSAEFRFYKDELYEIQFHCPDRVKVAEYLQKTFGTPNKVAENAAFWMGKDGAVSLAPRSGAFAYGDRKRTQELQLMLWGYMHQKAHEKEQEGPSSAAPEAAPPQAVAPPQAAPPLPMAPPAAAPPAAAPQSAPPP